MWGMGYIHVMSKSLRLYWGLCFIGSLGLLNSINAVQNTFPLCAAVSLGVAQTRLTYLHSGLLFFPPSYDFSAHAPCCGPIQKFCLYWSIDLERSSTVPAPAITSPFTYTVSETPSFIHSFRPFL